MQPWISHSSISVFASSPVLANEGTPALRGFKSPSENKRQQSGQRHLSHPLEEIAAAEERSASASAGNPLPSISKYSLRILTNVSIYNLGLVVNAILQVP